MAGEASAQREKQDQSIKARKNELFVEEQALQTGPRKKLRDYLKDTPAAPLSKNVKLSLWGSAVPVVLLFVAALLSRQSLGRQGARRDDHPPHAKPAPPIAHQPERRQAPCPGGRYESRGPQGRRCGEFRQAASREAKTEEEAEEERQAQGHGRRPEHRGR